MLISAAGLLTNTSSSSNNKTGKRDPSLDVYLEDFDSWDYNIFELEKITLKKFVGTYVLQNSKFYKKF